MKVTDSRRLGQNPQAVRRRRACATCGTTFQTDERPRLWVTREDGQELFLRGVLLASLRRAAADDPLGTPEKLLEVVRVVIVGLLAEGVDQPSPDEIRARVGRALFDQGLESVAFRYDPSLDPDSFLVGKRGEGLHQPFDREKLKDSITAASVKLLEVEEIERVVDEIEGEVGATSGAIDTTHLRTLVGEALRRRDERAFLRYALGGALGDQTLDLFLDRVAPSAQVRKRDGTVVLFEGRKLARSILRSFVPGQREPQAAKVADFVSTQERLIRNKLATERMPETTANIGSKVLEWLFDLDELAWANYWLVFASDHESPSDEGPAQQLARAQEKMRARRLS